LAGSYDVYWTIFTVQPTAADVEGRKSEGLHAGKHKPLCPLLENVGACAGLMRERAIF
jgi:hypothetical protein